MNKKQLIAMWLGIGIIALMGIFPPLMCVDGNRFLGYGFISTTNVNFFSSKSIMVDFARLLTQWIIVSVITSGLIITLKIKRD